MECAALLRSPSCGCHCEPGGADARETSSYCHGVCGSITEFNLRLSLRAQGRSHGCARGVSLLLWIVWL
eukprot:2465064-Alexandrium_andersonii.AAC.1